MSGVAFRGNTYTATKRFTVGTHRVCSPEETLTHIEPYFKRTGLTRLANITHLDRIGIPVVLSIRPNAGYLAVDAGKGFTLTAAMSSAAMETIERYHGEVVQLPVVRLPYARLEREGYVPIPLEGFSWSENAVFSPNRPESWVLGWDILNACEVAVPASIVLLRRFAWRRSELAAFQSTSNGLASGNNFLEAMLSGLLEVVERDAISCWQYAWPFLGESRLPLVEVDTVPYPLIDDLVTRMRSAQIDLLLCDCTTDTRVPTYMAYIIDQTRPSQGIYKGYGAHLVPEIAMIRAITEAIQGRLVYIAGARDDVLKGSYALLKKTNAKHFFQMGQLKSNQTPLHPVEFYDTFEQDIHSVCDKLRAVGIKQIIVFDLTLAGFDISVVRVVVPGLEGYQMPNIYAPGPRARQFLRSLPSTANGHGQTTQVHT